MSNTPGDPPTSSLIFPSSCTSLSSTLSAIKRSTLSISNRLHSISHDAEFVESVATSSQRPLVANERCGSWYIPPRRKQGSCYFKSTDGHTGEWNFNLRRLNLHLLDLVGTADGCIIVDSTRRGKRMPDALSKTIPIWCTVLNRALFPKSPPSHDLYTPPQSVTASEHSQMEARLDEFVRQFTSLGLDLSSLRSKIARPLRPLWVTQASTLPGMIRGFEDFHLVILCTASRRVEGAEASEEGYIQGAGDDSEGWSHGLTPSLFWSHQALLLSTPESDLPSLISRVVSDDKSTILSPPAGTEATLIPPTSNLYLAPLSGLAAALSAVLYTHVITISPSTNPPSLDQIVESLPPGKPKPKYLHLPLAEGKVGSRAIRHHLSSVVTFLTSTAFFNENASGQAERMNEEHEKSLPSQEDAQILIAAPYPPDHGIGFALAILCLLYDSDGTFRPQASSTPKPKPTPESAQPTIEEISKPLIHRRLAHLLSAFPSSVNPSRETLKAVNAFLMSPPS
ncbi:MAG: hypothetical protein M1837_005648 [Sclerophora amabilis]|nr:MAG: hypothetical protein M1837_005648 [Sclerophora amabilis]